jgi:hypothetical protein
MFRREDLGETEDLNILESGYFQLACNIKIYEYCMK